MGRPLNRRFFGDPSSPGNQLNVEAWIPGGTGAVSAWIVDQKSNTTYTVTDGTNTGRCKLQEDSITGAGQMRIEVMPFGFDVAAGTATMLAVGEAATDEAPAGSGYEPGDTVTLTGGTFSTAVVFNVDSVGLQSGTIAAGGSGFSAADTLTVPASEGSAGTVDVDEVFTIATQDETDFDGAGSNGTFAAGTGYSIGELITLTDGTIVDVDSETAGAVTAFNILSATSGTGPTSDGATLTQSSTTGGGSGFTLTLGTANQAVGTVLVATAGNYTTLNANPVSMTGGTGTGATITALYGSQSVSINTAGDYSVIPSNPIAQGSSSGSGTGASFNMSGWGVLAVTVSDGGSGYAAAPTVSFTGGSGTTATATLAGGVVTSVSVGAAGSGYSSTAIVSFGAPSADMEYAKILNSRQVKTFEGNVYSWDFIKVAATDDEADLDFS